MMSLVSRAAIKTQRNCRGNADCSAMAVVVVVVGESLLEGKCVCLRVCACLCVCVCVSVCVTEWCLGHKVESAITQKPLQL